MFIVWVDGSYQNVGRTTAEGAQYLRDTSIDGGADATPGGDYDESIDVGALGFGTKMTFQGYNSLLQVSGTTD